MNDKPQPLPITPQNIPAELKERPAWVLWRYEPSDKGKWTKVPYQANGEKASSTDPLTWAGFEAVWADRHNFDGIGIVFDNGLAGIDVDHHLDETGEPDDFARAVLEQVPSYTEITPSGEGLHILFEGRLPPGRRKDDRQGIEMYDQGRFFTVTGNHLPGTPPTIENRESEAAALHKRIFGEPKPLEPSKPAQPNSLDDAALIEKARNATNGQRFARLYDGNWNGDYPSQSEADLALCSMLAFWAGGDAARVDRLFRCSGLMREKWNWKHSSDGRTYGAMTVEKALQGQAEFYKPPDQARDDFLMPDGIPDNGPEPEPGEQPQPARKTRWTMAELASTDFPEPTWLVPELLPTGLSFLAGRPKLGKSWLALQLAHAIGTGGVFLGKPVEKRNVLYLALEDSPRRLQKRTRSQGIPSEAAITFETAWRPLGGAGMADLRIELEANDYALIVIDTISRALGRADQLDLAEMTSIIGALQNMAQNIGFSMLLIDHHRKSSGFQSNNIDDLMGSTGKAATADCILGLYREQGKHGATLAITGRDVEEQELAIEWDGLICCWVSKGTAADVRKDTVRAAILEAIPALESLGEPPTTKRIADYTGTNKGTISKELANLVAAGQVYRKERTGREQPYGINTHV